MQTLINTSHNTMRLNAQSKNDVFYAANILQKGGIVAMPTETVYGLAANGFSAYAIEKVFAAKNRPRNNPLILHVHDEKKAFSLFDFSEQPPIVKQRFSKLAQAFWPGPLTIVMKKARIIPMAATGNLTSVAVRVPNNSVTNAVLKLLDFPLVMPSANLSTRPSPTSADHVLKTLDGRIDAVLDDGVCPVGIESTVIKIDDDVATILRPGMIDKDALQNCLKENVLTAFDIAHQKPISPGLSYLHYSPSVSSVKMGYNNNVDDHWHSIDIVLITACDFDRFTKSHGARPKNAITIILSDEPEHFAKELYGALYQCEQTPERNLLIIPPHARDDSWTAILDRLKRTAGKK